ncbi:MAG TPA: hypothetical protein VMJ35_15675 [Dongiaceae bacterium]|nr:hypothetical protein [Dongiaceae bacterium]
MRREYRLVFLAVLLAFSARAQATTYSVKTSGGDYATIQACANAMAAGDTCTVYAGTYNEVVSVSSGSAGNYKILNVNGSDTVNVYGFTIGSHVKIIGFNITNPSSPASHACVSVNSGSTDFYITNNKMTSCGNGQSMISEPLSSTGVTYGYIQGNTLTYGCSTASAPNTCTGIFLDGNHQLIENNDISHVSDGMTNYANYSVFRGNTMHDTLTGECGSHSSNCHIDFIESEPVVGTTPPSQYNLYEGNTVRNNTGGGGNNHTFLTQGDGCNGQCSHTIIRYNVSAHLGSATGGGYGILDQLGGYTYVKTYNNTSACVGINNDGADYFGDNSTNGSVINSIYYFCQAVTIPPYSAYGGAQTGFTSSHNLAFCSTGTCSFQDLISTDAASKLNVNPQFVNASGDDYRLGASSPAIGAGTYLTTASNNGSASTSLTVADASFFYDGAGIVTADWIRIGSSTTAQIASVNYANNTITLTSPVSWSSGAGVYLYKDSRGNVVLNGANPDLGALPSGSSSAPPPPPTSSAPNPPTGLTATVN